MDIGQKWGHGQRRDTHYRAVSPCLSCRVLFHLRGVSGMPHHKQYQKWTRHVTCPWSLACSWRVWHGYGNSYMCQHFTVQMAFPHLDIFPSLLFIENWYMLICRVITNISHTKILEVRAEMLSALLYIHVNVDFFWSHVNLTILENAGVIEYYGMEMGYVNCHMCVESWEFLTTGLFVQHFWWMLWFSECGIIKKGIYDLNMKVVGFFNSTLRSSRPSLHAP